MTKPKAGKAQVPTSVPLGLPAAVDNLRTLLLMFREIDTDRRYTIGYGGLIDDHMSTLGRLSRSQLAAEAYMREWTHIRLGYETWQLDTPLWAFWTSPDTHLGVDYIGPQGWAGPGTAIWNELIVLTAVAGL